MVSLEPLGLVAAVVVVPGRRAQRALEAQARAALAALAFRQRLRAPLWAGLVAVVVAVTSGVLGLMAVVMQLSLGFPAHPILVAAVVALEKMVRRELAPAALAS
jgi:hypothetical protein